MIKTKTAVGLLGLTLALGGVSVGLPPVLASSQAEQVISSDPLDPYGSMGWYYVTTNSLVSSPYADPNRTAFHKGFDIAVYKQAVYSPQRGNVTSAGFFTDGTLYVAIQTVNTDPNNGKYLTVRNLHLESKLKNTNDTVYRGTQIGTSGNTGAATSTGDNYHLHFDVNNALTYNGNNLDASNTIDPELFWPENFPVSGYNESSAESSTESEKEHLLYNDPENYFEDTLVNYVGEEKFKKWLFSQPNSERKLSKFKKHFSISDQLEKEIKIKAKEKHNQ